MRASKRVGWIARWAFIGAVGAVGCGGSAPAQPAPEVAPATMPEPPPPPPPAPEPEPEAGRVELSTAFLRGGQMPAPMLDQVTDQVVQAIKDGTPLFRRCYAKALSRDGSVRGEIDIELVIKTDGSIGLLRPGKGDLSDSELIECTLRAFEQLRLPTPPAEYSIVAPMQFKPE